MALVLTTQTDPGSATWTEGGAVDQITDPGSVTQAIPVTESGSVALVSAGAEDRTVAAPTFAGQTLSIFCETFVGNITVTFATQINVATNTIATFTAASQSIIVMAVVSTAAGALVWRVVQNDATTLS